MLVLTLQKSTVRDGKHTLHEIPCSAPSHTSYPNSVPYPEVTHCLGLAKLFVVFACPCTHFLLTQPSFKGLWFGVSRMDIPWPGDMAGVRPAWAQILLLLLGKQSALVNNGHNQQLTLDMEWPSPLGCALPYMLSQLPRRPGSRPLGTGFRVDQKPSLVAGTSVLL